MDLSEVFLTFVVSSGTALILAVMKMCYKSKCSSIQMGCIKIVRNTEVEEREDEMEMKANEASKPESKNDSIV